MSIFPTKILLATDGSGEAELAASTAADSEVRSETLRRASRAAREAEVKNMSNR
jgi:hypothetical protein